MRHGENAMNVINAVKQRLAQIAPSLPKGVQIVTTYDRSELIAASIHTLKHELLIEMLIVSLVILIFLWHIPSATIPIFTLPAAVILAFIPMRLFGINANIMSLGGIAVAIGALVDAAVVVVENAPTKLGAGEGGGGGRRDPPHEAGGVGERGEARRLQGSAHHRDSGSRAAELLFAARDRAVIPADLCARSAGRKALQAAGVHEKLLDGHRRAARDHARSGAAADVHADKAETRNQRPENCPETFWFLVSGFWFVLRPHGARGAASDLARPVSDLWSGDPLGASAHAPRHRACAARRRCDDSDLLPARARIHAAAQRRRHSLHADHAARDFRDRGQRAAAAAGRVAAAGTGSRAGVRQSRPRRHFHRSRALLDDGDDRRP